MAKELNVDYSRRGTGGFSWRELRDLINQLPEEVLDRSAYICSDPPSFENPYGIYGLMTEGHWSPILIQEH